MSPEEVIRAKINSYCQGNCHYQNKKYNLGYKTILQLRRKLCQLVISHDTHPRNFNGNYEHPNNINNIDTDKNSDIRNNDTFRNDVNNSNTNSKNFNNNGSDNNKVNNIDTEKNIDNFELCYIENTVKVLI